MPTDPRGDLGPKLPPSDIFATPGVDTSVINGTAGYPKFVDLGNGFTIIYTDPNDPGQVVATKNLSGAGGSGDGVGWANLSQRQTEFSYQQQQDAADLAEKQRQYNETFGMTKARGDQQMQLEQELGRGNLDVSRGNLDVSRGRLGLDREEQALNYYKYLANLAANPRNFIENFFFRRGAPVPASAGGFGVRTPQTFTSANANLPTGAAPKALPAQTATSQYNPATDPNRGTMYEGLSGFNTDGTLRLAPNDPDAAGLMAKYPGRYKIGYAQGGVVPEPVVGRGLVSGQTYTFGEKGPEGVVPTQYLPEFLKRRGGKSYAYGGVIGFDEGLTNGPGDPFHPEPYSPAPTPNDPSNPYSYAYNPYDVNTNQTYGPQVPTGYGAVQSSPVDYGAIGAALAAAADSTNPNLNPPSKQLVDGTKTPTTFPQPETTQTPYVPPETFQQPYIMQPSRVQPSGVDSTGGALPVQLQPTVIQPGFLPQGSGEMSTTPNLTSGANIVTPRDVAAPGTFGGISGNRPQFLPGEDTPLAGLVAAGAVPPFLTRLFAQARGVQSQGTNQPFAYNLPADVPLTSKLAWLQMTPDEQQALLSYASAYGVTPEEYVRAIEQFSPQGETAPWGPRFGNQFSFARQ